jgi:hypothetical protein
VSWRGGAWSPKRSGFAFKIDYEKAIAEDEVEIAWAERSIERGWYRRSWPHDNPEHGMYDARELHQLVLRCPEVAASAGLSAQDVADFANSLDQFDSAKRHCPSLPEPQPGSRSLLRGDEVARELERVTLGGRWLHEDEAAARAALRRAKASRSRHRRNREKYAR